MQIIKNVSRRGFLKGLGLGSGVFVLATSLPGVAFADSETNDISDNKLGVFVSINSDGLVSIICHRSEMGQGIRTSIPQIIAEEMEANWTLVSVIQAQADRKYGSQSTAGSASIRRYFTLMRQIGAMVRFMLEQAAANIWQVDKSEVTATQHFVHHKSSGQKIGFGELAVSAAKLTPPKADEVSLKKIENFSLIGKQLKLVDHEDMVQGKAIYAQDIVLENMLYASIERPPVVGGKLSSFDASEAKKVPGVVAVIELKPRSLPVKMLPVSGVAVLASNTWAAVEGRKKLKVEWSHGDAENHDSADFKKLLKQKVLRRGLNVRTRGDVYQHEYDPKRTLEASYSVPYLHHAPMESPAATAMIKEDKCTIWTGTQNPMSVKRMAMTELGLDRKQGDQVEVNVTLMGGAFGRKSKSDFAIEAVELAKATGRPVKVIWSREDDVKHGYYHGISTNYCKAELSPDGTADFWIQRNAYPPINWMNNTDTKFPRDSHLSLGFADIPFELDHLSCEKHKVDSFVRPGWMRSVACIQNGFALGSFVDELAVKANINTSQMWFNLLGQDRYVDPAKDNFKTWNNYGLSLKQHPVDIRRMKGVIRLLLEKANIEEKLPENEGWGISFLNSFGSYVAAASKVRIKDNKVEMLEMHTAVDCGIVVTPDRVKSQMEGAMIFGLSIALMGEISVKKGAIEQSNFDDYPVTRMQQVPPLHVHMLESTKAPGGIGEPGVPAIAPSITNAIYHASGIRIRDLPVNKILTI